MSDTTHQRTSDDNDANRSSSYSFWTWLIAIILAIYLFWAWQHDHWSTVGTCCNGAPAEVAAPAAMPFNFSAGSMEDFHATGDANGIGWATDSVALKDWLNYGADWRVEGDANAVTLTGTVDSEATKASRGAEAQSFFGSDVTVNNLLTVVAPAAMPEPEMAPPKTASVYFPTSVSELPADANNALAPIVEWLNTHPESKAVISGFHDPRGDKRYNVWLSKNRAQSVYDYLASMGISTDRIEMREPQNVEGNGSLREARRAEVTIE